MREDALDIDKRSIEKISSILFLAFHFITTKVAPGEFLFIQPAKEMVFLLLSKVKVEN